MITRQEAVQEILKLMGDDSSIYCVINLGLLSREVAAQTEENPEGVWQRCLAVQGAMGSIIPLSLGLSVGTQGAKILGLIGDGSFIMSLNSLVTFCELRRPNHLTIIFDNRLFESTGSQKSQPDDFDLAKVCAAANLPTFTVTKVEEIIPAIHLLLVSGGVIVFQIAPSEEKPPRISEHPEISAERFQEALVPYRITS